MRFWLTKNSGLPMREQLVRQVRLGILSEELPPGHKLPSVRALARRHRIHANTVSAAYHELLEHGWLELRRGSGVYVRSPGGESDQIDGLLAALLKSARQQGCEPEEVLRRLEHMVRPRPYSRILVTDPEPELRAILIAEIAEHAGLPVGEFVDGAPRDGDLVAGLAGRVPRSGGDVGVPGGDVGVPGAMLALRLRSVRGSIEGQAWPAATALISIASCSAALRMAARAMLIAVGMDGDSVVEVDANETGWQQRIGASSMVITDLLSARELPPASRTQVFRVISDSSIEELKGLLPAAPVG